MRISVIVPTRLRAERLERSLASLTSNTREAELEILLGLDEDDEETLSWFREAQIPGSHALVGQRVGYLNLHRYVNALALKATGDWLMLWNDDALMQTSSWDDLVSEYSNQTVVLNPQTNQDNHARNQCIFPIFPRSFVETLGYVSQSNHYDTYIEWIANELGIRRNVPILILHERPDLTGIPTDEVYEQRQCTTDEFFGPVNRAMISRDSNLIAEMMRRTGSV